MTENSMRRIALRIYLSIATGAGSVWPAMNRIFLKNANNVLVNFAAAGILFPTIAIEEPEDIICPNG